MANYNRKYPKTTGYWVYAHTTPNGLYYIGMSKTQPSRRWQPSHYKDNSLAQYIAEYGWENITHKVIIDGLTKTQAEQWEDWFIQALSMNCLCINKNRSGGQYSGGKQVYMKQYREERKEKRKTYQNQYDKQKRSTPDGKIYDRVHAYNRYHPDKVIETPAEAKQKYLEFGYIPNYIKNDDLC